MGELPEPFLGMAKQHHCLLLIADKSAAGVLERLILAALHRRQEGASSLLICFEQFVFYLLPNVDFG